MTNNRVVVAAADVAVYDVVTRGITPPVAFSDVLFRNFERVVKKEWKSKIHAGRTLLSVS